MSSFGGDELDSVCDRCGEELEPGDLENGRCIQCRHFLAQMVGKVPRATTHHVSSLMKIERFAASLSKPENGELPVVLRWVAPFMCQASHLALWGERPSYVTLIVGKRLVVESLDAEVFYAVAGRLERGLPLPDPLVDFPTIHVGQAFELWVDSGKISRAMVFGKRSV